jgi:hypothetical protein
LLRITRILRIYADEFLTTASTAKSGVAVLAAPLSVLLNVVA